MIIIIIIDFFTITLVNFWEDIIVWYLWEKPVDWVKHHYYGLRRGIRNLIKWFPVVWYDANYDSCYMLNVMAFKIELMADSIERWASHVGYEDDVKNMRRAVVLLRALRDEDYEVDNGVKLRMRVVPNTVPKPGYSQTYTIETTQEEDEKIRAAMRQTAKNYHVMTDEVFNLIKREYRRWWD
jgi:hypothetical protein